MEQTSTFVGLDVHKDTIAVAMLLPGHEAPLQWETVNDAAAVRRLTTQLRRRATGEIYCCYEAGPCGFTPQRQLAAAGVACTVIAPSLIPRKPGERIKTDRRDARKLAELLRAGLLTAVRPPTPAEEAARDLCRTREDVSADLKRARQRLGSFLIRRGLTWRQRGRVWGFRHRLWLRSLVFAEPLDRQVFEHYLVAVEYFEAQLQSVDTQLVALADTEPYREARGLAADLSRHRHRDGAHARDRVARLCPVHDRAPADGVFRARPERALERCDVPARGAHENREHACPARAD